MKERLKNTITTLIGVVIMLGGIVLYVAGKLYDFEVSVYEMSAIIGLGYTYLVAKDTLIEGILWERFRIKKGQSSPDDLGSYD